MDELILVWFRSMGRDLPWRHTRDPHAIVVSEVMLQQTLSGLFFGSTRPSTRANS